MDRHLLTGSDLPRALTWLGDHLPDGCCWSLGVVQDPPPPGAEPGLHVSWLVGADVLNTHPRAPGSEEQRLADEMLARRHRVVLP